MANFAKPELNASNGEGEAAASTSLSQPAQQFVHFLRHSVGSMLFWIAVGAAIASTLFTTTMDQNDLHDYKNISTVPIQTNKGSGWYLGGIDPEHVVTSLPEIRSFDDAPEIWGYSGTGISLTTSVLNQMVPRLRVRWAFETISALSDRIRIAKFKKSGRLEAEALLSPQVLLDCGMRSYVLAVAETPGIGSGDCATTQCHKCTMNGDCFVVENPTKYYISEYDTLNFTTSDEFQLQAMDEIYHRGPIVASMYSLTQEFKQYKGEYILHDSGQYPGTTHVFSIVGWGSDANTGIKFWIVRNSIGTQWGDVCFFLVERGTNTYSIENKSAWAVPIV